MCRYESNCHGVWIIACSQQLTLLGCEVSQISVKAIATCLGFSECIVRSIMELVKYTVVTVLLSVAAAKWHHNLGRTES